MVGPPPLADGEAFIVGKAKLRRPVIVLAGEGFELFAGPGVAKPSDTFLCAPVYGGDQYTEEMRKRVPAYEYSNFFYLPESKLPLFREGMVRLDHVKPSGETIFAIARAPSYLLTLFSRFKTGYTAT